MRNTLLLMLLGGCSTYPQTRVGIIHEYIFREAEDVCSGNAGLHYIVSINKIEAKSSKDGREDYPCSGEFRVRCQDQTLKIIDDSGYCFISESQLEETLRKK